MNKIAIDIVLIPDDETLNLCKEINKNLTDEIDFNNTWKTPHISLLMWVMNESDLEKISQIVSEIGKSNLPLQFDSVIENYFSEPRQMNVPFMKIDHNKIIEHISCELQQKVEPLLEYENVTKDMFFNSNTIRQSSMNWVKWYKDKSVQERWEHITLGVWESDEYVGNTYFWSSHKIAIYHLSDNCTCEHKLSEHSI